MSPVHYHAQQREHIWMAKVFPCHYFLTEPLPSCNKCIGMRYQKVLGMTHGCNLFEVTCRVYSQNFDCDLATSVFAHPHVRIPAAVQGLVRAVVTGWDLQ
jgi:hypothetical protein